MSQLPAPRSPGNGILKVWLWAQPACGRGTLGPLVAQYQRQQLLSTLEHQSLSHLLIHVELTVCVGVPAPPHLELWDLERVVISSCLSLFIYKMDTPTVASAL